MGEVISGFQVDQGSSSIGNIGSIDSTPMVWKSGVSKVLIFATIAVEYYKESRSPCNLQHSRVIVLFPF